MTLIGGSAHPKLAEEISRLLDVRLTQSTLDRFADGEVSIKINETCCGQSVYVIQPCAAPVNDSILELLLTVSCIRRAGAARITAIVPYFGYKHHRRGSSVSTKHCSR